jgi:hypothetical protein
VSELTPLNGCVRGYKVYVRNKYERRKYNFSCRFLFPDFEEGIIVTVVQTVNDWAEIPTASECPHQGVCSGGLLLQPAVTSGFTRSMKSPMS